MSVLRPATNHVSNGRVDREPLCVAGVLVARQAAEDRLLKLYRRCVLTVVAGALIPQQLVSRRRQSQDVIEFAIG